MGPPNDQAISGPQWSGAVHSEDRAQRHWHPPLWMGQMLCDGSCPPSLQCRAGSGRGGPRERWLGVTGVLGLFLGARVCTTGMRKALSSPTCKRLHMAPRQRSAPLGPHSFQRTPMLRRELEEGPGPVAGAVRGWQGAGDHLAPKSGRRRLAAPFLQVSRRPQAGPPDAPPGGPGPWHLLTLSDPWEWFLYKGWGGGFSFCLPTCRPL